MIFIDTNTQNIAMTRGDYAAITFCAYEQDTETLFDLNEGDTVQLQICKKYGTPLKTYTKTKATGETTADDYTIEIPSNGTKDMKFGEYYYDVSIITADGYVCTYIGADKSKQPQFTILNEVGERTE